MRTFVLIALLGLAVQCLLSNASVAEEQSLSKDFVDTFIETMRGETQERDCTMLFGGCTKNDDCCKYLWCGTRGRYCAWDIAGHRSRR
uniref:U4-Theraphotoxin-Sfo1a_1 n=1 Tax=Selenotholus foelschei TaxID=1905327 RepID=A0A482Z827_9ARAC